MEMPTQKRKHDEFCRAENKHGQRKISFSRSSCLLELSATPSEQEKNLWATLLDPNYTTNHYQNTEMEALFE